MGRTLVEDNGEDSSNTEDVFCANDIASEAIFIGKQIACARGYLSPDYCASYVYWGTC